MIAINDLVKLARERRYDKVLNQCGTMRMLHVSRGVETTDIYTDVYILEERPSRQWTEVSQLVSSLNNTGESEKLSSEKFDRFGLSNRQKRKPGLDVVSSHTKLMILGKPGAGKTTFLKYLAVSSQKSLFQTKYIPIFITLKNLAENIRNSITVQSSQTQLGNILQNYIEDELSECNISQEETARLLKEGRLLLLLDGLDEVPEQKDDELVKQLKGFFEKFYRNGFILTCRIATNKYRFTQEGFTEVEIADFNEQQAESYIYKWFLAIDENTPDSTDKAESLIQKLKLPGNDAIRDLVVTPILLNLICLVFKYTSDFPSNRAELYREGLRILLYEWDEERRIQRDEVYQGLSPSFREQLLGRLAALTFEKSNYFFRQDEAQQIIADYLHILSKKPKVGELEQDSKAILKSFESQNGLLIERARRIYSFSHLTFHEYFVADYFLKSLDPAYLEQIISGMLGRWREVFILTGGMIDNKADLEKIKALVDELVAEDSKIQDFLIWIYQKSKSIKTTIKPAAVRSFYFGATCGCLNSAGWPFDFALSRQIEPKLDDLLFANTVNILEVDIYIDFALCFASFGNFEYIRHLERVNVELFFGEQPKLTELIFQIKSFATAEAKLLSTKSFQETSNLLKRIIKKMLEILNKDLTSEQKKAIHFAGSEDYKVDNICQKKEAILYIFELALRLLDSSNDQDERVIQQIKKVKKNLVQYLENLRQIGQNHQARINAVSSYIFCRNVSLDWKFDEKQKKKLWIYYHANLFLVNCLGNITGIDQDFHGEIENSLLLPFSKSAPSNSSENNPIQRSRKDIGGTSNLGTFSPTIIINNSNVQENPMSDVRQYHFGEGDNVAGNKTLNQFNNSSNLAQAARDIKELLEQLSKDYPSNTAAGQAMIGAKAIEKIEQNPTLRQRVINALKEAGATALEESVDHPAVKIVVAGVKGFADAQ